MRMPTPREDELRGHVPVADWRDRLSDHDDVKDLQCVVNLTVAEVMGDRLSGTAGRIA
jgi:hypothetical protein